MHALLVALVLSADPAAASTPAATEVVTRGEKLQGLTPVSLASVLATPDAFAGKTVAVEGTVRRACQKKGCWMELAATDSGPGMRVTFKDYGFFVPLDSAGQTARVEGTVKVAELTPAHVEHLKAEGATASAREVQLVASGVVLRR
jgi:hypothetical protein